MKRHSDTFYSMLDSHLTPLPLIYYHKPCYIQYALKQYAKGKEVAAQEEVENVWNDFEHTIRKRIIGRKDAFLLHNLLQHFQDLCKEYDIEDPIRYTYILRMELSNTLFFLL